jgi:hypothetical protein
MTTEHLEYNSLREQLIIPEYGRHIQKLIKQISTIESRDERNQAARYVISVLGSLNPHLRDVADFQHKLWDQLFIMADFNLDVDSPFPIPSKEVLILKPEKLSYPQNFPKYRFYGNNIKSMIDKVCQWEDGDAKNALIYVIANHMKKSFLSWNKDTVTDEVIFQHLYELSKGKINMLQGNEELSAIHNLLKVNQKQSNKHQSKVLNKNNNNQNNNNPNKNKNNNNNNPNKNKNNNNSNKNKNFKKPNN